MKYGFSTAIVCAFMLCYGGISAAETQNDAVAARVNDKPILLSELEQAMLRTYGKETLERLIYKEVLKQAMEQSGLKPSEADLKLALDEERRNIAKTYNGKETLASMAERELGMTEEQYVREVLMLRMFLKAAIVGDTNKIPEGELRLFWANNQGRYQDPPRVRLSHIFIRAVDENGKGNWEQALKAAQSAYDKAVQGADFADLARKLSEDKKTAAKGGDLGFIAPEVFEWGPGILQVAYGLDAGNIAGPVQSMWGYHVIKVMQKIPGTTPEFEKVKSLVLADYLDEKVQTMADIFTKQLVEKASITRYLDDILKSNVKVNEDNKPLP
jgi:parvulin-like peptidyl-prolyl isomerase